MLEEVLATSGFQAYSMFTFILKNDYTKFTNFLQKYQPDVILYDIAIPSRKANLY